MDFISSTQEYTCSIAPSRMFKALILESHNLIPKLVPQFIESIEFVQGDGGVGSIKQINFSQGSPLKHRIDALDTHSYSTKYTLIEGGVLGDKLESISYEAKFDATDGGGGCMCKVVTTYHIKGDIELKEKEIEAGKDKAMGMFNIVEDHLLASPELYAANNLRENRKDLSFSRILAKLPACLCLSAQTIATLDLC